MTFPHPSPAKTPSHKLLSSVFGPFAIDDLYGSKENRIVCERRRCGTEKLTCVQSSDREPHARNRRHGRIIDIRNALGYKITNQLIPVARPDAAGALKGEFRPCHTPMSNSKR